MARFRLDPCSRGRPRTSHSRERAGRTATRWHGVLRVETVELALDVYCVWGIKLVTNGTSDLGVDQGPLDSFAENRCHPGDGRQPHIHVSALGSSDLGL